MKIQELLTELNPQDTFKINMKAWHSPGEVRDWLESKGHRYIGSGAFGSVVGLSDDDVVVKVTNREDKCWLTYVNWCSKNEDNPHVPRIKSFVTLKNHSNLRQHPMKTKFHIAVMEKLQRVPPGMKYSHTLITEDDIGNFMLVYMSNFSFNVSEFQYTLRSSSLVQNNPNLMAMNDKELTDYFLKEFNKSLAGKAYRSLTNLVKRVDCLGDLHQSNLMYRPSTNSIVIIDPIANYNGARKHIHTKVQSLKVNQYKKALNQPNRY